MLPDVKKKDPALSRVFLKLEYITQNTNARAKLSIKPIAAISSAFLPSNISIPPRLLANDYIH
jgi:hypothetical protein